MTNFRLPFDQEPDPPPLGYGEAGPPSPLASARQAPPSPSASAGQGTVDSRIDARDRAGRERAVDPRFNVALEASAGTGKTRILVNRYVNLCGAASIPARSSR